MYTHAFVCALLGSVFCVYLHSPITELLHKLELSCKSKIDIYVHTYTHRIYIYLYTHTLIHAYMQKRIRLISCGKGSTYMPRVQDEWRKVQEKINMAALTPLFEKDTVSELDEFARVVEHMQIIVRDQLGIKTQRKTVYSQFLNALLMERRYFFQLEREYLVQFRTNYFSK